MVRAKGKRGTREGPVSRLLDLKGVDSVRSPLDGSSRPSARRCALFGFAIALSMLASNACQPGAENSARERGKHPPNVLIILTDDQTSRNTMSAMPETRRIFGEGGVRFTNAVATTPVCCPSRSSIFSGRYVHNHAVIGNHSSRMLDHTKTMQHELQEAGYTTSIVGKFLNFWTEAPPFFDRWAIFDRSYSSPVFDVDGESVKGGYSTTTVREHALDLLEDFEIDDGRPWMMQISPYAPHLARRTNAHEMVEDRYISAAVRGFPASPSMIAGVSEKPAFLMRSGVERRSSEKDFRRALRSLLSVDDLVREVFLLLDRLNESENTLAFFLSDNGRLFGQHGLTGKNLPYDESSRIPFYVRWPGRMEPGTIDRRIVANIDVAPTIYEATGVDPSYPVDGLDLRSSDRKAILLENLLMPGGSKTRWLARWTPRSLFVKWVHPSLLEYYAPNDPWQLHNVYSDPAKRKDPTQEERWLRWLDRMSSCVAKACP